MRSPVLRTETKQFGVGDASEDIIVQMDALIQQMAIAQKMAENQSSFINVLTYAEAAAGIWEKAPDDDKAVADTNGLYLNCVNSGLYMVNFPSELLK